MKIAAVFPALVLSFWPVIAPAQGTARMERIAAFYRNRDAFMGTVVVAKENRIVFEKSFGYAQVERQIPFERDTRFPIGSLSKQFTAAAVLLLQQDGKLETSDPVARFYPGAPAAWAHITLRNLLTQTSGIPDVDFSVATRNGAHQPEEEIKTVIAQPLKFEPGTKFDYSNVNYVLLGMAIERASGETYCRFLEARIFRPLGLTQTGCDWRSGGVRHSASGYRPKGTGYVAAEEDDLTGIAGAGGLYSTAGNLIRWTEALHGGRVLNQASLKEMTTPFLDGYAYGLEVEDGKRISHDGAIDGFYAGLDYLPGTRSIVVVLSNVNTDGNRASPGAFAMEAELMELLIDKDSILPSEGKELALSDETLRHYVGRYKATDSENAASFTVTLQGNHLMFQADGPGNRAAQLRAESQTDFYVVDDKAELEVDFDPDGSATIVDYNEHSGIPFTRISESK